MQKQWIDKIRIPTNTDLKNNGFEEALSKCKSIEYKFDQLDEDLTEMEGAPWFQNNCSKAAK